MSPTQAYPKRVKPQRFDTPQTWFRIDKVDYSVIPLHDVVYVGQITVKVKNNQNSTGELAYYRSEVFPTFVDAAKALAYISQEKVREQKAKLAALADEIKIQEAHTAKVELFRHKAAVTPHPDAYVTEAGRVYFVSNKARELAAKITGHTEYNSSVMNSYWFSESAELQAFITKLRMEGMIVVD